MVSIGKISGLNSLFPKVGQNKQVSFGQGSNGGTGSFSLGGKNDLQSRLDAIDKGNFSVTKTAGVSTGTPSMAVGSSSPASPLQSRLDNIGTGELSPNYNEKKLNYYA